MLPGAFVYALGGEREPFFKKVPSPSLKPTPLLPKTFTFIESLFAAFPKARTGTGANKKVS